MTRKTMEVMMIEAGLVQRHDPGDQFASHHSSGYEFLGGGIGW